MMATNSKAARRHPNYAVWREEEARQRASYIATREVLVPYLVPHLFEGALENQEVDPTTLGRAKFGYGIGLNRAWVQELLGHVRGAPATYDWGGLGGGQQASTDAPTGIAGKIWADATLVGDTWTNFFEGEILEWITTSPGGLILVDNTPDTYRNKREELKAGKRPYVRFLPMSNVLDGARNDRGWWWIKVSETIDERKPDSEVDTKHETQYLYFELKDDGTTEYWRTKADDVVIEPRTTLGSFKDVEGFPTLPIVEARLGRHHQVPFIGTGLLAQLADIVIDLFNVLSEAREAYRDAAFSVIAHNGPEGEKVLEYFKKGSRFIPLGDDEHAKLQRVSGDVQEVSSGLELIRLGVQAWALSARRKAADSAQEGNAEARSGVSLQAEFQLDAKPLLVTIAEKLDEVETSTMFLLAQLAGKSPQEADKLTVERSTAFRLEEEATRITRLVAEFVQSLPLTATMKRVLMSNWAEASGLFDMDAEVDVVNGTQKLRDAIDQEAKDLVDREEEAAQRRAEAEAAAAGSFGRALDLDAA